MRQVTWDIVDAFLNGYNKTISNSTVFVDDCNVARLYLHGNCIAIKRKGRVSISNAGWESVTTKERLNGLLEVMGDGRRIYQRKGTWYWSGEDWPEDEFPFFQEVYLN
jgi:hypothetical protein